MLQIIDITKKKILKIGQNIIMWQKLYIAVETLNVNSCVNCYKWTLSEVKK